MRRLQTWGLARQFFIPEFYPRRFSQICKANLESPCIGIQDALRPPCPKGGFKKKNQKPTLRRRYVGPQNRTEGKDMGTLLE